MHSELFVRTKVISTTTGGPWVLLSTLRIEPLTTEWPYVDWDSRIPEELSCHFWNSFHGRHSNETFLIYATDLSPLCCHTLYLIDIDYGYKMYCAFTVWKDSVPVSPSDSRWGAWDIINARKVFFIYLSCELEGGNRDTISAPEAPRVIEVSIRIGVESVEAMNIEEEGVSHGRIATLKQIGGVSSDISSPRGQGWED